MARNLFFSIQLLGLWIALSSVTVFSEVRDQFFQSEKIRVLILSGRNNHDWRKSTPMLRKILNTTEKFDVRVNEEPAGMSSVMLKPYHLVVLDYQGPRWEAGAEAALSEFVRSGGGLVIFHGASYGFSGLDVLGDRHQQTGLREEPWEEFLQLSGGVWSSENPETGHGERHSFRVKITDEDHPVTRGMENSFIASDELYHDLKMHPEVKVLATAYSDPATGGTGEDEPVLWTLKQGKGRVFHTTLGHDLIAMSEEGFMTTFARGCEWAATGQVSLPSKINIFSRKAEAPRVLVVTGGHDYDTEFYSLFNGNWLTWSHASSNERAFAQDIREKYDVLLLYDLSRELSETGRRNLRRFVESGKGIVSVHHAIADYNSWTWWWKEVIGGKYNLEDGDLPASTYKHDVEMFIRPVGQHPITQDIGPMHFYDETYKGMWISPDVKVILETDEPTSDGPIAWISPYPKSRVVYIQAGHDRHAFLHPGYRKLIRQAILWAAVKH